VSIVFRVQLLESWYYANLIDLAVFFCSLWICKSGRVQCWVFNRTLHVFFCSLLVQADVLPGEQVTPSASCSLSHSSLQVLNGTVTSSSSSSSYSFIYDVTERMP